MKLILILALTEFGVATQASGNAASLEATLTAPSGSEGFGKAVAVADGIVVIGAHESNEDMGRAFLYRITDYTNKRVYSPTELTNPRTKKEDWDNDHFGFAVAASNAAVVVGAHNGPQKGAVYYYNTNGFFQSLTPEKIIPKEGIDNFGYSLALWDDTLVVSDPSEHPPYEDVVWTSNQKITSPRISHFGDSLALSSKLLVVGAWASDEKGVYCSGAVYVYAHDESRGLYVNPKKIRANDGAKGDSFGISVATSMDTVYVGTSSESVYVYKVSVKNGDISFNLKDKLTKKDKKGFGRSLAASEGILVVGAPGGSGLVYVYKAGDRTKIPNPRSETVKSFGYSVAISGNTLVVGTASNEAYVYDLSNI